MATTLLGSIGKFIGEKFVAFMTVIDKTYAKKTEVSNNMTAASILQKLNSLTAGITFTPNIRANGGYSTPGYKIFDSDSALLLSQHDNSDYLAKITGTEFEIKKHLVCTSGGGTASTSDIRFKKDITPLPDVLGTIMDLKPIKYTWAPTEFQTIGISAQDLQKKFPELVHPLDDPDHTLTIEYDKIGGTILLKALQEEVTIRRRQIKALNRRILKLESKIK